MNIWNLFLDFWRMGQEGKQTMLDGGQASSQARKAARKQSGCSTDTCEKLGDAWVLKARPFLQRCRFVGNLLLKAPIYPSTLSVLCPMWLKLFLEHPCSIKCWLSWSWLKRSDLRDYSCETSMWSRPRPSLKSSSDLPCQSSPCSCYPEYQFCQCAK